ncbi:MAG: hypothetical protein ABSG95_15625 [Solirubrobacteraceae bacterium]|jgi:hypothetical protein
MPRVSTAPTGGQNAPAYAATQCGSVDEGAWQPVARLHRELDPEVLRAYDFPDFVREDPLELEARLANLHAEIGARRRPYNPFV